MAAAPAAPGLLRIVTCGSVDDGKSTLIGRLLHDAGAVSSDRLAAVRAASGRNGVAADAPDLALLADGLAAEREQGITIDVAHLYFSTPRRSFIVADSPGHELYTRNMATAASTADLAVILVDAAKGLLTQTRRHAYLVRLLGVPEIVLAVNKLDLADDPRARFEEIAAAFGRFAQEAGIASFTPIPVSGLRGDNVVARAQPMGWYEGPTLLEHLETVELAGPGGPDAGDAPLRMPVQWVNRGDGFRGYCGTIAGGAARPGDRVRILPSAQTSRIARIATADGDLPRAGAGDAVTLTFADEVDCSRGDVVCAADAPLEIADQFEAHLVWMDADPLLPGRSYLLKTGAATVGATVTGLKHRVDMGTLRGVPARSLARNDIALVNFATDRAIPFAPYEENRTLGSFVLIDRLTNATAGAGMIRFALRRAHNIHWQRLEVDARARAALKHQQPAVLWFTGLSGAGKSTIANLVEKKLHGLGRHTYLLDGDNVRHGLNRDLGFTDADRVENIRRIGEVARLMADAGLIVLAAFISPFRAERRMVREMMPEGRFLEIWVDTPLEVAERRDAKGLYRKARAGELPNFTGISSPYEAPDRAEIRIDTARTSAEEAAERIVAALLGEEEA